MLISYVCQIYKKRCYIIFYEVGNALRMQVVMYPTHQNTYTSLMVQTYWATQHLSLRSLRIGIIQAAASPAKYTQNRCREG